MSDENVVICASTTGLGPHEVIPGSRHEHCMICAEEVWVSPSTDRVPDPRFICNECAPGFAEANPGALQAVTPEQRAELHRLGHSDETIDRMVLEFLAHQQRQRKKNR